MKHPTTPQDAPAADAAAAHQALLAAVGRAAISFSDAAAALALAESRNAARDERRTHSIAGRALTALIKEARAAGVQAQAEPEPAPDPVTAPQAAPSPAPASARIIATERQNERRSR